MLSVVHAGHDYMQVVADFVLDVLVLVGDDQIGGSEEIDAGGLRLPISSAGSVQGIRWGKRF